MNAAVGLMDGLSLDGDRCIRVIPQHGHYCLYYAFKKCEGYSMEDIINNFPTKDDLVDVVNKIFYICEFSQCSLLQCCSPC